jgi:hypothetical protein
MFYLSFMQALAAERHPEDMEWLLAVAGSGVIPVVERLETLAPPGKFGALVDIGVGGRLARVRLVDDISCPVPASIEEFWEVPLPPASLALHDHAPIEELPNMRYTTMPRSDVGALQGVPLEGLRPIDSVLQATKVATQKQKNKRAVSDDEDDDDDDIPLTWVKSDLKKEAAKKVKKAKKTKGKKRKKVKKAKEDYLKRKRPGYDEGSDEGSDNENSSGNYYLLPSSY